MANLISVAGFRKLMLIMLVVWSLVMVASGKLLKFRLLIKLVNKIVKIPYHTNEIMF